MSNAKHADACALPVCQGKCAFFGSTVPSRGQRLAAARQSRSSLRVNAAKQSGKQFSVRYNSLFAVACNLLYMGVPASSPEVRHRASNSGESSNFLFSAEQLQGLHCLQVVRQLKR